MGSLPKFCWNCRFAIQTWIKVRHAETYSEPDSNGPSYVSLEVIHCQNLEKFKEEMEFARGDLSDNDDTSPEFTMLVTGSSIACEWYEQARHGSGPYHRLYPEMV